MNDKKSYGTYGIPAPPGAERLQRVPSDAFPENSPVSLSGELLKTQSLLSRAIEVADTMISKISPEPTAVDRNLPKSPGLMNEACVNNELALTLCARLDELAKLIG